MSRTVLRTLVRSALVLATAGVINAGCSRQAEGERCDLKWAGQTQDCDSGLICTACGDLEDKQADRCCRADGSNTVAECARATSPTGTTCSTHDVTGAAGRASGSAGAGGSAGASAGGTSSGGMSSGGTGGTDSTDMTAGGASGQPTAGAPGQ